MYDIVVHWGPRKEMKGRACWVQPEMQSGSCRIQCGLSLSSGVNPEQKESKGSEP
jgi:hypothetical protein